MLNYETSFIETQFPVSKVSKESYKERKAVQSQTLTGLGKWWGRKPLFLVRATILGLLLPVGNDPIKDREMFFKLLTMDDEGLLIRKNKTIPVKELLNQATNTEKNRYFELSSKNKVSYKKTFTKKERTNFEEKIFLRLSYDEKLKYCMRPEEVNDPNKIDWKSINQYYQTNADNLQDFISEIGIKRFGRVPRVGDCFSGGGSIPFETYRMGLDVYASDLNPVAMLLTWAGINLASQNDIEITRLENFQNQIYSNVDDKVLKLGIETNEQGDRANAFLYCTELTCPECDYKVPLSPSWMVGKASKTVVFLKENDKKGFDFEVVSNASDSELKKAEQSATFQDGKLVCPHCNNSTPIGSIRKDRRAEDGSIESDLRKWDNDDFSPSEDDIFRERLYCIRYERQIINDNGDIITERYYREPSESDLLNEEKVKTLLSERFSVWQEKGYIPKSQIEVGEKTEEPIRTRGWQYWHQLFNPRQLLLHGLFLESIDKYAKTELELVVGLLGVNRMSDWNSKLCRWGVGAARESIAQTFYNQALNTLYNYGSKGLSLLKNNWLIDLNSFSVKSKSEVSIDLNDASIITENCDFWITDPPYADAVNYHELSEFFLAWDKTLLNKVFPSWIIDSRRALAVKGKGESFHSKMIDIYRNISNNMNDKGTQVVMFTHQDVKVWADLTLILWSAGLKVTAAWNIATETEAAGLKDGNYVKGTVLLFLKKQTSDETAYLDELYPEVEIEVKNQIDKMRELDDREDPNFSDADYLLAAYAASLKVLTAYKQIEDINIDYEISKSYSGGEVSPIEKIINEAIKIAFDYLTPTGFDSFTWKVLLPEERFYIKGLDFEKEGVYQLGAYQEIARGFGVREYQPLLANTRANQTRLKTAKEFAMRGISDTDKFGSSIFRNVLAALYQSIKSEDTSKGRNWLKNELSNYWNQRGAIIELLNFISSLGHHEHMQHWEDEAKYARLLSELVKNDGV